MKRRIFSPFAPPPFCSAKTADKMASRDVSFVCSSSLRSLTNLFTSSLRGLLAPFTGTGKQVPPPILPPFERLDKTSRITIFSTGIDQPRFKHFLLPLSRPEIFISHRHSRSDIAFSIAERIAFSSLFFSFFFFFPKTFQDFFDRRTIRSNDCSNFERV